MAGKFCSSGLPSTELMKKFAEELITKKLDEVSGIKDLVLDAELMSPLDRILGASVLKQHGVEKIFKLENPAGPMRWNSQRVYVVRSRPQLMRIIASQILIDIEGGVTCKYKVLMVPRKLHSCEKVLEEEGVFGYLTVDDLPLNLVVIDNDILSLESKSFFRSFYLDKDQTCLYEVAQSLNDLQHVFGDFENVFCIGNCAQKVDHLAKMLARKDESSKKQSPSTLPSSWSQPSLNKMTSDHFSHLILVDRDVDYATPLCSQVTYEGLLDDTLDVSCGFVLLGPEVTNLQKPTKVLLGSQDVIYQDIRNRHFANVSTFLSGQAKELQEAYKKIKGLDVSHTKEFVQKDMKHLMAQHNSLSIHIAACEYISKKKTKGEIDLLLGVEHSLLEGVDIKGCCTYLEELINRQVDMCKCLSLLCLMSVTEGGLSSSTYKSLTTQFLQSYGYQYLSSLYNLKRLGLLLETSQYTTSNILNKVVSMATKQGAFRTAARKLRLIPKSPEEVNLSNSNDMSYVFSGAYSPLLCKIIEQIVTQDELFGLEELFKQMNVPTSFVKPTQSARSLAQMSSPLPKAILVYFLGGCSYSEVAALRFLAKQRGFIIVVATTSIINSQNFLKSVMDGL